MRPTLPFLLVVLALLAAGCASPEEGTAAPPTPATPTPDGNESDDGDEGDAPPAANETPEDAENETEPAPEPAQVYATTYGFPTSSASTEAEAHTEPFAVILGYERLDVNVTFTPSTSAGLLGAGYANGIRVGLLAPDGSAASDACTLEGPVTEAQTCSFSAPVSGAGEWKLVFEGSGAVSADVTVDAS